jgi:hypothetical protein
VDGVTDFSKFSSVLPEPSEGGGGGGDNDRAITAATVITFGTTTTPATTAARLDGVCGTFCQNNLAVLGHRSTLKLTEPYLFSVHVTCTRFLLSQLLSLIVLVCFLAGCFPHLLFTSEPCII